MSDLNEESSKAILCAMDDLKALVNAEDWAEIVKLKSDAKETLIDLIDNFPMTAKLLQRYAS